MKKTKLATGNKHKELVKKLKGDIVVQWNKPIGNDFYNESRLELLIDLLDKYGYDQVINGMNVHPDVLNGIKKFLIKSELIKYCHDDVYDFGLPSTIKFIKNYNYDAHEKLYKCIFGKGAYKNIENIEPDISNNLPFEALTLLKSLNGSHLIDNEINKIKNKIKKIDNSYDKFAPETNILLQDYVVKMREIKNYKHSSLNELNKNRSDYNGILHNNFLFACEMYDAILIQDKIQNNGKKPTTDELNQYTKLLNKIAEHSNPAYGNGINCLYSDGINAKNIRRAFCTLTDYLDGQVKEFMPLIEVKNADRNDAVMKSITRALEKSKNESAQQENEVI